MPDPIIAVEHVHKSVTDSTGTLDILRDIDFTLAPQETAAIVGASGSGKSTLLSIVAGLDTPTRGTYLLTYNGFGGAVPRTYEQVRVDRDLPNVLRMWRQTC